MPDDGRVSIAVAGEDHAHRALIMGLTDAILRELVAWLEEPDHIRQWRGLTPRDDVEPGRTFYKISGYKNGERVRGAARIAGHRVPMMGRLGGKALGPAGGMFREVVTLFYTADVRPPLLVLLMDTDGDLGRVESAAHVCAYFQEIGMEMQVVIGLPHQDAEGWFLAGAELDGPARQRLASARQVLGFDPTREPEKLTAVARNSVKDAKRVLQFVAFGAGPQLRADAPESRPPAADEADVLAAALGRRLSAAAAMERCGLQEFVTSLRTAIHVAFHEHI